MRKSFIVLCLLLVSNFAWCRSSKTAWENLDTLQPGDKILVVEKVHDVISGAFISANAQGITLYEKNGKATIERGDVARVLQEGRRLRHMLFGIGIGASAGAVLGAISHSTCKNCEVTSGEEIGSGVIFGVAVGAIVGALLPGYRVVFEAGKQ